MAPHRRSRQNDARATPVHEPAHNHHHRAGDVRASAVCRLHRISLPPSGHKAHKQRAAKTAKSAEQLNHSFPHPCKVFDYLTPAPVKMQPFLIHADDTNGRLTGNDSSATTGGRKQSLHFQPKQESFK